MARRKSYKKKKIKKERKKEKYGSKVFLFVFFFPFIDLLLFGRERERTFKINNEKNEGFRV